MPRADNRASGVHCHRRRFVAAARSQGRRHVRLAAVRNPDLESEGKLQACDRFRIEGSALARGLAGVAGTSAAQGSLFILTGAKPAAELVAAMREALLLPGVYAGAALLPNRAGAWARILATDAAALKTAMFKAGSAARNILTGAMPVQRRK